MKITEEMLVAFADGELESPLREQVEAALAADPALARRVEAHRRLRGRIAAHFAPIAQEPVPERLKAMLTGQDHDHGPARERGGNVVSLASVRAKRSEQAPRARWLPRWGGLAAMAASLVLGLAVGQNMGGGPVAVRGGTMVARGSLEKALDTQLASAQAGEAATRIGLTFRSKGGDICRTFSGRAVAGLACHDGGQWRLEQVLPGAGKSADYRQASAGDPRLAAAVGDMIAGEPFDAEAEKAARDGGW